MNKRRLLKLADLLEKDASNKKGISFDLQTVIRPVDGIRYRRGMKPPKLDCGTAACAIGLWGLSRKFKGVSMDKADFWPVYEGKTGLTAAMKYFLLSQDEGEWLFLASSYRGVVTGAKGERAVAKRIRRFVAGKEKPAVAW